MRKIATLLLGCAVAVTPAFAQMDDAAYCTTLSDYARRYLTDTGADGGSRPSLEVATAIEDCRKGNTAAGIKELETRIRNKGFTPPKRG